ncbi:MAG: PAS domain S-box protein [Anaerolineales bacterium]|nr:PAS domain S-box protein [Anaerolineales bacterium]
MLTHRKKQDWQIQWQQFISPAAVIQEEEQRQRAGLLAGLSLALLLVSSLVVFIWVWANPGFTAAPAIATGVLAATFGVYVLSRTRFYQIGAVLLILILLLTVGAILVTAPGSMTERMLALNFLAVGIFLASILLSVRLLLGVVALCLGMTAVFFFIPAAPFAVTFSFLVFLVAISALLLLTTTMRNRYVQRLRESQSRYQALFSQSNDAVFIIDLAGKHLEVNRSAAHMLGYAPDEIVGLSFRDLVAPTELPASQNVLQQLLENRRLPIYERKFRRKDGSTFPAEVNVELVRDAVDRPLHIQSLVRDISTRKTAENALRASEERFRRLTLQSPDTIYIYDLIQQRVAFTNRDAFLGYTLAELQMPGSIVDRVHPADRLRVTTFWQELLHSSQNGVQAVDYRIQVKNSTWEWVHNRAIVLSHTPAGMPTEVLVVLTLITESKRLQAALQAQEAQFQQLVETTRVIPWVADRTFQLTYIGPQATTMLGYPVEAWYEPGFWAARIHADDRDTAVAFFREMAQRERDFEFEYRMLAADGRILWFRNIVTVQHSADGPDTIRGFLIDVSERRRAEEARQQQEAYLRILFEQTPIGIITLDMSGEVTDVNPRGLGILGSPGASATVGLNVLELPPLVESGISLKLAEALTTGKMVEMETWYTSIWQKRAYLLIRAVPHFDGQQRQMGLIVLVEDMTHRLQIEERMRQMQKMESLSVMAGAIAHDFNNLLVAMLGQTSLALAKLRAESPGRTHVEKAVTAAEQAARLTQQLLAYSGRGQFQVTLLNLNTLIDENLHLFAVTIPKHIHLRTSLAQLLPLVEVDVAQIQQVVMNLIINAAEALSEERGTITIVTDVQMVSDEDYKYWQYVMKPLANGTYVTLEIHDDGPGMDADTLAHIFDPFYTTKERGHGLGLAAVLGIVRGHRGGLTVYSEIGRGTTFKLLLPASEQQQPAPTADPLAGAASLDGLVLVIDDEAHVREAVSDILGLENIGVLTAVDGESGLALYQAHQADITLVLLDLSMPGWSGERTLRELRKVNPDVRIILSSGYNEVEATQRFAGRRLTGFLQKPYSAGKLLDIVNRYQGGS